jgi:hypothetical protein
MNEEDIFGGVITGGAVSNSCFRTGYSGTFGVIVALFVNAIILLVMDVIFKAAFGEYSRNAWVVGLFMLSYIFVVGYYVSDAADKIGSKPYGMFA